jgi:hypothetical protein
MTPLQSSHKASKLCSSLESKLKIIDHEQVELPSIIIFFRVEHNFQPNEGTPIKKQSLIFSYIIIIFTTVFPVI